MNDELEKRVLRIIQDYCYKKQATNLLTEFCLTVAPRIARKVENSSLTHKDFISICNIRKDFFLANEMKPKDFGLIVYKHLKKELSYYIFSSFLESLLEYKRRMENGNLKGFPESTKEDTLRSDLSNYIRFENFCEPRCGSGACDIIIPSQKCIVETKIWRGIEYYNSGIPELMEYLKCQGYKQGYYIIFDYNLSDNDIIKDNGEYFSKFEDGIQIEIIFIRMKKMSPSKIYKNSK